MEVGVSCSAPDLLAMHLCDVDSYPLVPPESLSKVCSHIKRSLGRNYNGKASGSRGRGGFYWTQDLRKLVNPTGPAQW